MTRYLPLLGSAACLTEIVAQSDALAAAAAGHDGAVVEHCPGWTVTGLVDHVIGVHRFWSSVVERRLTAPPEDQGPPNPPAAAAERLDALRSGARQLVAVLGDADPAERVWTWAPSRQDVAFVTRHQVQEAAVHRWDAEHAAGREALFDPVVAADSIEEFLTFSVASPDYPAADGVPGLGGPLVLAATDGGYAWTISDGAQAGTLRFERGAGSGAPAVRGTAGDLLLFLYGRRQLAADDPAAAERVARLSALSYTG